LSYDTKEEELKAEFEKFGNLLSAAIITRRSYRRKDEDGKPAILSLGYGFVEFERKEDAEKACAAMDKKEFEGRPINVEIAKPPSEAPRKSSRGRGRGRGGRSGGGNNTSDVVSPMADGEEADGADDGIPEQPSEPSKTTVFVSNLPFKTTVDELKEFFNEHGFTAVSAHVATRRVRGEFKSKGFGFVELADEEQQKRAVKEINGKLLGERELVVKVAMSLAA